LREFWRQLEARTLSLQISSLDTTMVNHGARKGCMTCKLRKIHCGLELPSCRQCMKSGRVCLGYADRQSPSHHSSSPPDGDSQSGQTEELITIASLLADLLRGANTEPYEPDEQATQSSNVASSAIITIKKCLYALHQTEQSFQDRRALIAEYSATTSKLRAALMCSPVSPSLACAAFLFSTYEVRSHIHLYETYLLEI
jgi:hypothetical protein